MLFLDRVVDVRPGASGTGLKAAAWAGRLSGPAGAPSFPWIVTLEMLAQTAGIVCAAAWALERGDPPPDGRGAFGYLTSIDADLHEPVRPFDPLEAEVSITRIWSGMIMFQGTVKAAERSAVRARMSISAGSPGPAQGASA
jgi:3-hydroxymyristoyl/3-hydroxydecanoyl-(acyl carrier protein) dehydratase